ncbi:MAG TPA: hypothetical protein VGT98_06070 [Candidatus Elarobacter sp.]|nr:hypothetical protein [Candidatus Elarobacter sp.]
MKPGAVRRVAAIAVLVLWIGGLLALWRRHDSKPDAERLAQAALRLEPATYFYTVSQNGVPVGVASSALDTTRSGLRATDVIRARLVMYGDSQSVRGVSTAYLSRGFSLDSFALGVGGDAGPLRLRGTPHGRDGVLLPHLAPVALMLTREPRVGSSEDFWIYNPLSRQVERVTLGITAESLFTVVDSASFDSRARAWVPAHSDTVRAWSVTTPSRALAAWVDAQGRVVRATEPGGLALDRTAYEIAALNLKARLP